MTDAPVHRIVTFVVIAFGWAWLWWSASILLLHGDPSSVPAVVTTFLGTCAPAVAAWTIWCRSLGRREAGRRLARCVIPSGPWRAWVVPSVAILAVVAVASWVQQHIGGPIPSPAPLWLIVPQLLVLLVAGGGQEEIGWRGWLHPAVRARTGRWRTAFIVAAVWFCWHLPLWGMPGSIQTHIPLAAFAMMLLGLSLLLARTLEMTRGRAAVAIWLHALNNLAAGWLIFVTPQADAPQPGSWALGAAYLVIGIAAMLIRRRPPLIDRPAMRAGSVCNAISGEPRSTHEGGKMNTNQNGVPAGYTAVAPWVVTDDTGAFLDFVAAAFGGEEIGRVATEDGSIGHGEIKVGDTVVLAFDRRADWPLLPSLLRVFVPDADAAFARALAAGAHPVTELSDSPFGQRGGRIKDPFGNIWWVVTHVEDVSEEQLWERLQQPVHAEQMRIAQETLDAELTGRAQGRSSAPTR